MSHNITVEGGKSIRLKTSGKYCDQDIVVTSTGGSEDFTAELAEYESLNTDLAVVIDALPDASNGGAIGNLTKYEKVIAKPTSTSAFVIENPLGGLAKKVFVKSTTPITGSSRKIHKYVADYDLGLGVIEAISGDGSYARYAAVRVDSGLGNAEFMISEGSIELRQYSAANNFDTTIEYEVEIYE